MAKHHSDPPEFRSKIIELVRAGRGIPEAAREFKLSEQTVRNWLKQDQVDGGRRDGLTTGEREELAKLRRENKQLRIERERLSKAAAWFARDTDAIPSKAYQAVYPIAIMCRVLKVSASGYYAWRKRAPSLRAQADLLIGDRIEALHRQSRNTYGRPRIQGDRRDAGIWVGDKRVARLMRVRKIHGASRRKGFTTTVRDVDARPAPDLVERKFTATAPDQLWVADITYVPTNAGYEMSFAARAAEMSPTCLPHSHRRLHLAVSMRKRSREVRTS